MSRLNEIVLLVLMLQIMSLVDVLSAKFAFEDPLPQFDKSTLIVGNHVKKPIATGKCGGAGYRSGKYLVSFKDNVVSVVDTLANSVSAIQQDAESKLMLKAAHNDIAYFAAVPSDSNDKNASGDSNLRIRRLDLRNLAWDTDIKLEPAPGKGQSVHVVRTYVDDEYVVAVTALSNEDNSRFDQDIVSFCVSCFRTGEVEPKWFRSFKANKTRSRPGVYLWSSSNPDYAVAGLQVMSRFDDRLIIVTEGKQPILCLNIDTGTELWRCDRVWEFQRGFIGPSVWQHYIDRFRIDQSVGLDDDARSQFDKAEKQFNDGFECSIIGGPAVIELKNGGSTWRGGHSIFVAVSKQPMVPLAGYLGESVIYELSDDGNVVSTTNLPRLVDGSDFRVDDQGVTWKCQSDQIVRLEPSSHSNEMGMGPGGFDRQTNVVWMRTMSTGVAQGNVPWLDSKRCCKSIRIKDRFSIAVTSGGFVAKKGDSLYQFPIAITDLENGSFRTVLLQVPFEKPVPAPENNYSKTGDRFRTSGPYLLAITGVSIFENRLQLIMGIQNAGHTLEFDLPQNDLIGLFSHSEIRSVVADDIQLSENLTLLDAATDPDTRRIEALLKRGADVNERSKNGWSALMKAACYGSRDVVDLLIKRGANVDFADQNCGGQTTLMWAARSGRSSKRKVRMLIDAGADIWKRTDGGSDLLMSAAGAGNIEVVELLLELGMKPDTNSDSGYTALMSAANKDNPELIKILVAAGAQINAADNKGKTALMFAAEGYDQGEMVQALLNLGADPNLKDSEGMSAFEYSSKSNSVGQEQRCEILKKAMRK